MKPITFPLPFLGLNVRIEAAEAPARRLRPVRREPPAGTLITAHPLPRRVLQDIGLDTSRAD